jgi:hypothetical protein
VWGSSNQGNEGSWSDGCVVQIDDPKIRTGLRSSLDGLGAHFNGTAEIKSSKRQAQEEEIEVQITVKLEGEETEAVATGMQKHCL